MPLTTLPLLLLCAITASASNLVNITTAAGDGVLSTFNDGVPALEAHLSLPGFVAPSADGRSFFISDSVLMRVLWARENGTLTTIAGTGVPGFSGDGGDARQARLSQPAGIAVLPDSHDLLVCDRGNRRIRRIHSASGNISSVTGAVFFSPHDIAVLPAAPFLTAFVADTGANRIYQVSLVDGSIVPFAGTGAASSGADNLPALLSGLRGPAGIAATASHVYVSDSTHRVRAINLNTRTITTVAGMVNQLGYSPAHELALATSATLNSPVGLTTDVTNQLLVIADLGNFRVRQVNLTTGLISTITGQGSYAGTSGEGDGGAASLAGLRLVFDVAFDTVRTGDLFVADQSDRRVRRVLQSCPAEWMGPLCADRIDLCESSPCANGAQCAMDSVVFAPVCVCPVGWTGKYCDQEELIVTGGSSVSSGGLTTGAVVGVIAVCVLLLLVLVLVYRRRQSRRVKDGVDEEDLENGMVRKSSSLYRRGANGQWTEDEVEQLKAGSQAPGRYGVTGDAVKHKTVAGIETPQHLQNGMATWMDAIGHSTPKSEQQFSPVAVRTQAHASARYPIEFRLPSIKTDKVRPLASGHKRTRASIVRHEGLEAAPVPLPASPATTSAMSALCPHPPQPSDALLYDTPEHQNRAAVVVEMNNVPLNETEDAHTATAITATTGVRRFATMARRTLFNARNALTPRFFRAHDAVQDDFEPTATVSSQIAAAERGVEAIKMDATIDAMVHAARVRDVQSQQQSQRPRHFSVLQQQQQPRRVRQVHSQGSLGGEVHQFNRSGGSDDHLNAHTTLIADQVYDVSLPNSVDDSTTHNHNDNSISALGRNYSSDISVPSTPLNYPVPRQSLSVVYSPAAAEEDSVEYPTTQGHFVDSPSGYYAAVKPTATACLRSRQTSPEHTAAAAAALPEYAPILQPAGPRYAQVQFAENKSSSIDDENDDDYEDCDEKTPHDNTVSSANGTTGDETPSCISSLNNLSGSLRGAPSRSLHSSCALTPPRPMGSLDPSPPQSPAGGPPTPPPLPTPFKEPSPLVFMRRNKNEGGEEQQEKKSKALTPRRELKMLFDQRRRAVSGTPSTQSATERVQAILKNRPPTPPSPTVYTTTTTTTTTPTATATATAHMPMPTSPPLAPLVLFDPSGPPPPPPPPPAPIDIHEPKRIVVKKRVSSKSKKFHKTTTTTVHRGPSKGSLAAQAAAMALKRREKTASTTTVSPRSAHAARKQAEAVKRRSPPKLTKTVGAHVNPLRLQEWRKDAENTRKTSPLVPQHYKKKPVKALPPRKAVHHTATPARGAIATFVGKENGPAPHPHTYESSSSADPATPITNLVRLIESNALLNLSEV